MFNTKKDVQKLLRKIYYRLNHGHFMVRLIRSKEEHGLCYKECNWIELTANGEILNTLVHEMLHDIYPDWSEKKVEGMERLVFYQLSHKQIINLGKKLFGLLGESVLEMIHIVIILGVLFLCPILFINDNHNMSMTHSPQKLVDEYNRRKKMLRLKNIRVRRRYPSI